ncbi:hypothetical protein ES703_73622 [subsurface metagenome]
MGKRVSVVGSMIECYRLAERTEYYRVYAGNITAAHRVHTNGTFLPEGVFAASAVGQTVREFFAGCFTDILS